MQSRPRLVLVSPAAGLVLALALFAPDVAHPGSGAWTSSGPPGSYFTAVVPHRTSQGTWFAAAIGPGSRFPSGRMALKRCVKPVSPSASAARV